MSNTVRFDENAVCDRCGRFGGYVFAAERLCLECYETRGSCCSEFEPERPSGAVRRDVPPGMPLSGEMVHPERQ